MDERLNEINRELKELNEALARQGRMEAQWKDLQDQRAERDRRVMETGRVFRKEQDDVDRLEKGGLRALLLSLTGDREVRLSKERREALAAKLQYDQAQRDLEDLDGRIGVLLREKDGLRIDRIRRDALLEEKGELLKALGGETGARLARLDQQLDELEHQRREVGEAISAGRTAESALSAVLNSLDSAEDWGTWDMLGGGLLTTMAKHGHLDDAQAGIGWAQQCRPASALSWPTCGTWSFPRCRSGSSPPLPTTSSTGFSSTGTSSPGSTTPSGGWRRWIPVYARCSTACNGWIRSWRRSRTA